ncbi:hypothetical protein TWF718_007014 [Orbilia javanica]|uniref:Uncharacterized protein n=1 Tax=Orbilia javanica TaxID=47235 RepID=A0AAN8MR01_9PEZI
MEEKHQPNGKRQSWIVVARKELTVPTKCLMFALALVLALALSFSGSLPPPS